MACKPHWMLPVSPQDKAFYQTLGKRIAEQRKSRGITQVQLADRLGIAQQTMAHYEGGRLRMPLSLMPTLANELNVTISELMEETAAKKRRGPASKLQQQIEQVRQLPRAKQKLVSEMLEAVIQQAG